LPDALLPFFLPNGEVRMRRIIVGVVMTATIAIAPAIAGAEPPPNGRNCVGVADSAGARAGGFGGVVSGIASSGPGAIATSLATFVSANCTRPGPGQ
jgi:hypothetical protein